MSFILYKGETTSAALGTTSSCASASSWVVNNTRNSHSHDESPLDSCREEAKLSESVQKSSGEPGERVTGVVLHSAESCLAGNRSKIVHNIPSEMDRTPFDVSSSKFLSLQKNAMKKENYSCKLVSCVTRNLKWEGKSVKKSNRML